MRLPTAPPKMRPMADCSRQPPLGRILSATRRSTTSATSERSPTIQRQPAGIPERRPNASPGFMTRVRATKPWTTGTGTPGVSRLSTISLVSWSRTTTTAASVTTRAIRDRSARIAGTTQPRDDRDATLAERGVRAVLADVLAPRPAPLALLPARAIDADDQPGDVLALVGDARTRSRALERHARHAEDVVADGLRRAPPRVVGQRGVEPVLDDVEIEGRQVHRAEVVHAVEDGVELVLVVGPPDAADQARQAIEDPAIDLVQARVGLPVARGIEIAEVAEQEPERVAHSSVRVGETVQDLERDPDVLRVVLGRHPQAQDLGAVLRQQLVVGDDVTEGLRHLPSLAVHEEPVGHDALVGRRVARPHRLEQRGLEPAAVLVRALEIELGRPVELGTSLEHGGVAATGVEPHVEDVALFPEALAAALRASRVGRQELARRACVPLVGALALAEDRRDVLDDTLLEQERLAAGAVEGDDRHAPDALPRDDPFEAVRHHVVDAILAPRGDPLDIPLDRLERVGAEIALVEVDEPLLGRAEERRVLATPAVRVRVVERALRDQHAHALEVLDDLGIRVPHREPREVLDVGDESPGVVYRIVDLEAERFAELVVFLAVPWCDVHEAGSLVHPDEVRSGDLALARDPRMAEPVTDELVAGHARQDGVLTVREQAEEVVHEGAGDDVHLVPFRERDVLLRGMHRDREIRRQGPRRRGPDHREGATLAEHRLELGRNGRHRELDPDRRRPLVLVLDLGLRERGPTMHAPVDGLQALVDQTASDEAAELARDDRLVRGIHRDVRIVPVAEHAQTLELASLDVDEAERVFPTLAALLDRIHRVTHVDAGLVETELLVDLVLDRQSVTVPARHVDGVESGHRAALDDHVLQDLVQDVAEMEVAVGVRRCVVQDPDGAVGRGVPNALVDSERFPPREHLRLALEQIRPHRDGGFRQI